MIPFLLVALAPAWATPIVNGQVATEADFPMTGALLIDAPYDDGEHEFRYAALLCSATLIAPDTVLLAAHCLDLEVSSGGAISMGEAQLAWTRQADLTEWDMAHEPDGFPADAIEPSSWSLHPDYRYSMITGITGPDLALLFLDSPVEGWSLGWVPTAEEDAQVVEGAAVTVVGWGMDQPLDQPQAGMGGQKLMGPSTLYDVFEDEIEVGFGDEARQCFGDSGGPTFMQVQTTSADDMRVIGVASMCVSYTGCENSGVWNVRVGTYRDWIDQEMRARCADGSRAWCENEGLPSPDEASDTGDLSDTGGGDARGCGCSGASRGTGSAAPLLGVLFVLSRFRRPMTHGLAAAQRRRSWHAGVLLAIARVLRTPTARSRCPSEFLSSRPAQ